MTFCFTERFPCKGNHFRSHGRTYCFFYFAKNTVVSVEDTSTEHVFQYPILKAACVAGQLKFYICIAQEADHFIKVIIMHANIKLLDSFACFHYISNPLVSDKLCSRNVARSCVDLFSVVKAGITKC